MKRYLMLFLSLALFAACDYDYVRESDEPSERRYLLTIRNTSDKDISVFVPDHGDVDCKDVTGELPDVLTPYLSSTFCPVDARTSVKIYITLSGDVSPIETYHVQDKVTFYFFDRQVLLDNSWATVKADGLWLKKLSLSPEDVIDAGKVLVY